MEYKIPIVLALAVIVAGTTGVGAYAQYGASDSGLSGEISLGLISPLTGDVAQYGEENLAATELAVADFNEYLAGKDAGWSVSMIVEDSETLPTAALERLQSLHARDISVVLGPWSSASLQNVKGYADSNGMLLFSCCSTSPLIAISGDSVFRMSPDDSKQGTAIGKIFEDAGLEVMVPVWREDAWGVGLQDASRESFESRGGIVDDGLGYSPETSEFSSEVSALADTVRGYVNDYGADKVGVLYIGFGEVLPFMQSASGHAVLYDVRWFGSDANTNDLNLVEDPAGLQFVTDTRYTTVQVASGKNDLSRYVDSSLQTSIGRIPSTYASSAYDMMWIAGLAIEREQSVDVAVLTKAIPEIAAGYNGALGSARLNDYGDLAQTNYDIWDIRDGVWTVAGTYFASSDTIKHDDGTGLSGEIQVGSILPLTGRLSKHGEENWAASVLATVDFNKYLADNNANWSLSAVVEDSQTSPTVALEKLQALHAKSIKIVLGPETSSNLQNMKGYADANEILLFSCCSTSPLLAISGDTIFRMAPDDTNQGTALGKIFTDAGMEAVVPVWREDAWGVGLVGSVRDSFTSKGGTVADGLGYNPEASDFSAETSLLAEIVREYVGEYGADKVAVMYIGFGEGLLFMQSASGQEILSDVRWFGTDANTRDPTFVDDPIGLEFVNDIRYTTVQVASGKNDISKRVDESLVAELGRVPSTYASSAYDAVWIVGLAMDREQSTDVALLRQAIPEIAAEHTGALGSTLLNDYGDLAQTNYDVWDIRDGVWTLAGTYFASSDTIKHDDGTVDDEMKDDGMVDDEMKDDAMEDKPETPPVEPSGGGCLIATAAYGSELAPQVQFLREIRDNTLLSTASGTSFMTGFNQFYYSFSPAVADLERESVVFRDAVRVAIAPALYTLNIMTLADQNSDASVIAFGLLAIAAMAGIYVAGPVLTIRTIRKRARRA